jgi:outer membrane protein assembly factor BamB
MKRYISDEDSLERISVELGSEVGPVDIARILAEVGASETPQFFGIKKGGSISSDIVHRDGKLYFSCCDGNFYCLESDNGNEIWRYSTNHVMPAFSMDEDTIYASGFDHKLYALTLNGKLKWTFATNGKLGNNPEPSGDNIYFGSEDGNLYCLNKHSGKLVWKYATSSPVSALPYAYKGRIYFGNFGGTFYALDLKSGALIWKFRCNSSIGGCDIYDDIILLPSTFKTLYALDLKGRLLWTYKSNVNLAPNVRSQEYNGKIFFGNRGKSVTAIEIKTGKVAWEFKTREMTFSYNKVRDGIVYFGSCDTNFYAVDAETGKEIWRFTATGPNVGGVDISEDRVWFGSWDCHVYCLNRKDGQLIWKFQTSMSNMSDYEVDTRADKQELEITVNVPERKKDKEAKADEVTIADYGEFSGTYIDTTKTDYLGVRKKGYVK